MIDRRFVDGSSVFGVALTLFTIKDIAGVATWNYWVLLVCSIIFGLFSITIFWSKPLK